jgi:hypothetical protein
MSAGIELWMECQNFKIMFSLYKVIDNIVNNTCLPKIMFLDMSLGFHDNQVFVPENR